MKKMENFIDADKRKRSFNWDSTEIALLQQIVQDNLVILRSKLTNSITNQRKNAIWKDIASKINALGLHFRSDKDVKTKWQNMQTKAKKEFAENKKYTSGTGGGPAPKSMTNETELIVEMMEDCSSFVGLKGSESSVIVVNPEDISNFTNTPATIVAEAIVHHGADSSGNDSILALPQPIICSTPRFAKKRKTETVVTQAMLTKKQFDVLSVQEEKFKLEIENIKLCNAKIKLEIRRLEQWEIQEDAAALALAALE